MEIVKTNALERWRILRVLGYDVDRDNHVVKEGQRVVDYFGNPVDVRHCAILPGRKHGDTVVINDDILNLTIYMTDIDDEDLNNKPLGAN
jgi:hypothetical protein